MRCGKRCQYSFGRAGTLAARNIRSSFVSVSGLAAFFFVGLCFITPSDKRPGPILGGK